MPARVGNARTLTDAKRLVAALASACIVSVALPDLLATCIFPALIEAVRIRKELNARESQAWPEEKSRLCLDDELQLGLEGFHPLFKKNFRVAPHQLARLRDALEVPDVMYTDCGKKFTGTTGLLALMARMGDSIGLESLGQILEMDPKRISAICNTMVRWMTRRWGHVIHGGLIESRLPLYVDAIQRSSRIHELQIFGFIDCTVRGVARPTHGQEALYTRHKSKHGVKYQALSVPDGLIVVLYGPRTARRHDSRLLDESGLEELMRDIQRRTGIEYLIYGDSAYSTSDVMMTGFSKGACQSDAFKRWFNKAVNGDRTSVEWGFGQVTQMFPGLNDIRQNQILRTPVGLYYQSAVFLTNCVTCLKGGTIHYARFHLAPPTLEEYLASEDI